MCGYIIRVEFDCPPELCLCFLKIPIQSIFDPGDRVMCLAECLVEFKCFIGSGSCLGEYIGGRQNVKPRSPPICLRLSGVCGGVLRVKLDCFIKVPYPALQAFGGQLAGSE